MELSNVVYYIAGGCLLVLIVALVVNFTVNTLIRQFTESAMRTFKIRLGEEVGRALGSFKNEVCEHLAQQERKTDSLARLYAALIDLIRDGKSFVGSFDQGDRHLREKNLRIFEEAGRYFGEQNKKQSLYYSDEFKGVLEKFETDHAGVVRFWEEKSRLSGGAGERSAEQRKQDLDEVRKNWAGFEDRAANLLELTRSEFRSRSFGPESVMKKWFSDSPAPTPPEG